MIFESRPRRYLIETWGCQMNQHDTEKMAGILVDHGYAPTTDENEADLLLLNTCSVREKAETSAGAGSTSAASDASDVSAV